MLLLPLVLLHATALAIGSTGIRDSEACATSFGKTLPPFRFGGRDDRRNFAAAFKPKALFASIAHTQKQDQLFVPTPGGHKLDNISTFQHTTLLHPAFPHHTVRIKKSDFCDGTVRAYTGYIDVEARHLFFYFFESRRDPLKDDFISWMNGGSAATGLFMELGPCLVVKSSSTAYNPDSWNSNANMIFIDQPVGVGYSYAEYGEAVSTTFEAAKDVAAFFAIFFEYFSEFSGRPLHMAGESYAGRFIPVVASEVHDQNPRLVEAGMHPVNLSSIMLGNGLTDFESIFSAYYDMRCTSRTVPPIQDIKSCVRLKQSLARCEKWLKESCFDRYESINCKAADDFCEQELLATFPWGVNPYDLTMRCGGEWNDTLCYPVTKDITAYLSRSDIRIQLGVDPTVPPNFTNINHGFLTTLWANGDRMFPAHHYVAALLERGVRVLTYVGVNDVLCNWIGQERMTLAMEWSGQKQFVGQPLEEWTVEGRVAGKTRVAGPLTFATIHGAGHMAPYDKPKETLEMVQRWLTQEPL
ncbi:serine carboxypeptidase [Rhodofomes roseus]|uniref:Carboxypeptidase n=1 Tax=Rhodofomes roseus TaxID=34475 RepID=A0ABQ8KVC8_9APHY|nr:serine carboxypeptidase [Rhodofomes roseus]KAH9842991.1 serine carboxypeptidase [Rhodofomes roseus]